MPRLSQDPKKRQSGSRRAEKGKAVRDLLKGRICTVCSSYKDRDQFYPHPSGFNGLGPRCKECARTCGSTKSALATKRMLYASRKELGVCIKCGASELVDNCIMCLSCWFRDKAANRAGGVQNVEALRNVWDQQKGRCYYTEEVLVPGTNASVDHQIPVSRGGTDEISNLKWTTSQINVIKNNLTHDEFVAMCSHIANKFKKHS